MVDVYNLFLLDKIRSVLTLVIPRGATYITDSSTSDGSTRMRNKSKKFRTIRVGLIVYLDKTNYSTSI